MLSNLSPSLAVQREIHRAATEFLIALAEEGSVQGVDPRPTLGEGYFLFGRKFMSMGNLERALNPRRVKHGDPALDSYGGASPFGDQHAFSLARSLYEIRKGFALILKQWGFEALWGCDSYGMGGIPGPGCSYAPGHVQFTVEKDWAPPIPKRIYDAMVNAAGELAQCIQAVETAVQMNPALLAKEEQEPHDGSDKPSSAKRVKRDKKTEARDKWIYQQCCKRRLTYDGISRALKAKHPEWEHIESATGILKRAKLYAERHGLPQPPRRLEQS